MPSVPVYRMDQHPGFAEIDFLYQPVVNRSFSPIKHSHDFYELLFVFSGNVIHHINEHPCLVTSNQISVVRPGDTHLPVVDTNHIDACMLSVDPAIFIKFADAYGLLDLIEDHKVEFLISVNSQQMQIIKHSFYQMQYMLDEQKKRELRSILGTVFQNYICSFSSNCQKWYSEIVQEMSNPENLSSGMPTLQRITNLSHSQLCRVFKKQFNQTPHQFIKELRLGYAYKLISNTNDPFENISSLVGYSSFSHFSQAFKERYSITPSALRKKTTQYW